LTDQQPLTSFFWLYQLAGWSLFALLQLLIVGSDEPLTLHTVLPALLLLGLALGGSVLLRVCYQRWRQHPRSQLQTLGLLWLASLLTALLVDVLHYGLLWPAAQLGLLWQSEAFQWFDAQPPGSKAPLLLLLYLFWSMLYLTLSRQLDLRRSEQQRQTLEVNITAARLNSLLAQLSPHFMFNCINNIRALILEDPGSARLMLTHFADVLRYQIQPQQQALVPLAQELAVVDAYLALLQIQYEQRLQWQLQLAPECKQQLVPGLALQLLVENAVKHGISQHRDGGCIEISISRQDNCHWQLQVSNPGRLAKPGTVIHPAAQNTGTGLTNLRQRLQLLYGTEARLLLIQDGDWVRAQLCLPLSVPATGEPV
jgi:sensor histidine kinase YesM